MLSSSGAKLKKYINNVSLQDMTRTLGNTQNKSYISFVFSSLTSPKKHGYKHYANVMLISTSIMAMKVALTYKFLVSNIYYIEIFNKTIYISSILEEKYIVFKIFYYVLSLYSIFYVISKILIYIFCYNNY